MGFTDWFNKVYGYVWRNTTGEPWTNIMRRHRWLLPVFAIPIVLVAGRRLTDSPVRRGVAFLIVGGIGVVAGHVYWP